MAITEQMAIMRIDDIGAYAEVRALVRLVRQAIGTTASAEGRQTPRRTLRRAANAAAAAIAEALRGWSCEEEIQRLRQASVALGEVRVGAWRAYVAGFLGAAAFDAITAGAARCEREVLALEASSRHRARRRIDGAE